METIDFEGFLKYLAKQKDNNDRRFCFILGAGASKESGIPTGAELSQKWYDEIKLDRTKDEFSKWISDNKIEESKLAQFYPEIYEERFRLDHYEGFEELRSLMENKNPSCGYAILSKILVHRNHNIVITTNFDTLTEDALFIYNNKKPLVIGHELLYEHIKPFMSRPMIIKIHRDLFLSPMNTSVETNKIDGKLGEALSNIFKYYKPIVIGYGGNDGSLMKLLGKIGTQTELFWLQYQEKGTQCKISDKVKLVIEKHEGTLIQTAGFNENMLRISRVLEIDITNLGDDICDNARSRSDIYNDQISKIIKDENTGSEVKEVFEYTVSDQNQWVHVLNEAYKEKDVSKRANIIKSGLNMNISGRQLLKEYIKVLESLERYDEAEDCYINTIDLDPTNATSYLEYAVFLNDKRKNYDKAEEYYQKSIELDPTNPLALNSYGAMLYFTRKDYKKAEELYIKALAISPNEAGILNNYGLLVKRVYKDFDKAEEFYKKAIEIDPNFSCAYNNYASLLANTRKDYKKAEEYYQKAIDLDPNDAEAYGNYANMLGDVLNNMEKANEYYIKAIELNPKIIMVYSNYARFLVSAYKNYDKAMNLLEKASEFDEPVTSVYLNLAYLQIITNNLTKAEENISKALFINMKDNEIYKDLYLWFYRYAIYFHKYPDAYYVIKRLLPKYDEIEQWDFSLIIDIAKKNGHPHINTVIKFAEKISGLVYS